MNKSLPEIIVEWRELLLAEAFTICHEQSLPYGWQFKLSDNGQNASFNIYQGKKGLTLTVSAGQTTLHQQLRQLINGGQAMAAGGGDWRYGLDNAQSAVQCWAGSDESGKGDVFGPLVVAAVSVDNKLAEKLLAHGIKDCKKINDCRLGILAATIHEYCFGRYSIVELPPEKYNRLYGEMKHEGKNLNDLLAWAHSKALSAVMVGDCLTAVVDKFAGVDCLNRRTTALPPGAEIIQVPRGEQNIAVAAASVLARNRFITRMSELSTRYAITLPKGAAAAVVEQALIQFSLQFGRERLTEVAKLHFRNLDNWR